MAWLKKCVTCGERGTEPGYRQCAVCMRLLARTVLPESAQKPTHPEMTEPDALARLDDTLHIAAEFAHIIDEAHLTSVLVDLDDVVKDARFDRAAYQARIDRLLDARGTLKPGTPLKGKGASNGEGHK